MGWRQVSSGDHPFKRKERAEFVPKSISVAGEVDGTEESLTIL
jgi:hypothetical protein